MNCFRRVVRSGVHQALDIGEGRELGAVASIVVVSPGRAKANHVSSWLGEGASGGRRTSQSLSRSVRLDHLPSCQRGLGLLL